MFYYPRRGASRTLGRFCTLIVVWWVAALGMGTTFAIGESGTVLSLSPTGALVILAIITSFLVFD